MDAMAEEKRAGHNVATVIRGGVEPHGAEVIANARSRGLKIVDVHPPREVAGALDTFAQAPLADVYNVTSFMADELISLFYSGADAVLANSGHEPFGLVGLEVMAAGGVAFVGATGEDYAVPFLNCIALDTDDPAEINIGLDFLRRHPETVKRLRSDAMETAASFSWKNVVQENLLGKLRYVALRQLVTPPGRSKATASRRRNRRSENPGLPVLTPGSAGANRDAAEDALPKSLPYGGRSVSRRPSIKPRLSDTSSPKTSEP
jgi:hypothetical protein